MKRMLAIICLVAVGACTTITEVPNGTYKVSDGFEVDLGRSWALMPAQWYPLYNGKLLTIDGLLLNTLHIVPSIEDGHGMFKTQDKDIKMPVYQKDMSEVEIAGFVIESLARTGFQNLEQRKLYPVTVSGRPAARLEFGGAMSSGLLMEGIAVLIPKDGTLDILVYTAPKEYYFDKRRGEVESIIASIRLS